MCIGSMRQRAPLNHLTRGLARIQCETELYLDNSTTIRGSEKKSCSENLTTVYLGNIRTLNSSCTHKISRIHGLFIFWNLCSSNYKLFLCPGIQETLEIKFWAIFSWHWVRALALGTNPGTGYVVTSPGTG